MATTTISIEQCLKMMPKKNYFLISTEILSFNRPDSAKPSSGAPGSTQEKITCKIGKQTGSLAMPFMMCFTTLDSYRNLVDSFTDNYFN